MILEELTKKGRTVRWLQDHKDVTWRCIHCGNIMTYEHEGMLCEMGHRYDLTKQGYFFLAKKAVTGGYDSDLFEARRRIIQSSPFFAPLHQYLRAVIDQHLGNHSVILDAGSGEGAHLIEVGDAATHSLIATDLSKAAIQKATDFNGRLIALVADLAALPVADDQVDLLLDIFSPSNYREFHRVVKTGGIVVKVVPRSAYLNELRMAMGASPYANSDVVESFMHQYPQAKSTIIQETIQLSQDQLIDLVRMTPLTWQLDEGMRDKLIAQLDGEVTLDVLVLVAEELG